VIPRPIVYILLVAALIGGAAQYRAHVFTLGIAQEKTRRDTIDVERDRQSRAELAEVNARLAAKQAELTQAIEHVAKLKSDIDHEKANSAALQSDLAAGRRRLSVAIAGACRPAQAGNAEGAAVAGLDPAGESATTDLLPRTAGDLEWTRSTRNEAILAARACVSAYDSVSKAANGVK
jgi:Sec-independent protein translocase protein TatA